MAIRASVRDIVDTLFAFVVKGGAEILALVQNRSPAQA
jgi:hypothetical protein